MNDDFEDKFTQKQIASFHKEIYRLVGEGLTLIEAITEYCEARDVEVHTVVKLIDPAMIGDITTQAIKTNLLKKEYRVVQLEF